MPEQQLVTLNVDQRQLGFLVAAVRHTQRTLGSASELDLVMASYDAGYEGGLSLTGLDESEIEFLAEALEGELDPMSDTIQVNLGAKDLATALMLAASAEGKLVCGVLLDARSDTEPFIQFGNLTEQGADLAKFYRQIADIIEKRAKEGLLKHISSRVQ